ncbi:MAG: hypothetical protein CMO81_09235 [Waddliaceae bacterium]|nr:hypothetical protein [Waddliaceae bacterium]
MLRKYFAKATSFFFLSLCICSCTQNSFQNSPDEALSPNNRSVLLIELTERHLDSFELHLTMNQASDGYMPFIIENQRVYLRKDLLNETDPAVLLESGLTLGNPNIPLSQCKVLIKYTKRFEGVGRSFSERWFYAFSSLPATIHLPGSLWDDAESFEVYRSPGSPLLAIEKIRLFGEINRLKFCEVDEGDSLHLTCGHRHLLIHPNSQTILQKTTKNLAVHIHGITLSDVELDPSFMSIQSELPQTLLPDVHLDDLQFSSKLNLRYHGRVPISIQKEVLQ